MDTEFVSKIALIVMAIMLFSIMMGFGSSLNKLMKMDTSVQELRDLKMEKSFLEAMPKIKACSVAINSKIPGRDALT